jgi:NCAIR mutase (PurE)-related protein
MNNQRLRSILTAVAEGRLPIAEAETALTHLPFEDIEFAQIDHHRSLRRGFPEVVFGEGKTADQLSDILERMLRQESVVLATRVDADKAARILARLPGITYHAEARMLVGGQPALPPPGRGTIMVISAGTSDIPVAREAMLTAEAMGHAVAGLFDVGVAGLHRLLAHKEAILSASVLIVAAGMEGALPSVVGGLVARPVIAVPTSVGYGASFGGVTALLGMLNSCSSNVAVVNIDNGFGAGYLAALINRLTDPRESCASPTPP